MIWWKCWTGYHGTPSLCLFMISSLSLLLVVSPHSIIFCRSLSHLHLFPSYSLSPLCPNYFLFSSIRSQLLSHHIPVYLFHCLCRSLYLCVCLCLCRCRCLSPFSVSFSPTLSLGGTCIHDLYREIYLSCDLREQSWCLSIFLCLYVNVFLRLSLSLSFCHSNRTSSFWWWRYLCVKM